MVEVTDRHETVLLVYQVKLIQVVVVVDQGIILSVVPEDQVS